MLAFVTIEFCHMDADVGCPEPSNMTSLKPPWLALLIADGEDPSRADSLAPGKTMELSNVALKAKSSSSIGLFPAKGLPNCGKGDCGWPMPPLKW